MQYIVARLRCKDATHGYKSEPHSCRIGVAAFSCSGDFLQVFEYLAMTRVYTKPRGQMPDYSAPVILRGVTGKCNRMRLVCERAFGVVCVSVCVYVV